MGIWVRVFCKRTVAHATPEGMREGIAERLRPIAAWLGIEEVEAPEAVVARLRVEDDSEGDVFEQFSLFYREDPEWFLSVERWAGQQAKVELDEFLEEFEGADKVRRWLSEAAETVAFELKLSDAEGMGSPVAIAGALWLAEIGGGVVQAEGLGWLVPEGVGADVVAEE